jgi:hypothetical protein
MLVHLVPVLPVQLQRLEELRVLLVRPSAIVLPVVDCPLVTILVVVVFLFILVFIYEVLLFEVVGVFS